MNAKELIQITEGHTPFGWETTRGVYANLTRWPEFIQYYVKCSRCGLVHGDFKSLKDAMAQKLCDTCNMDVINKLKDEVTKVVDDPEHKPKAMTKIIGEADDRFDPFDAPPDEPETGVPPLPAEDMPDVTSEIDRLLLGNWVDIALRDFAAQNGEALSDLVIDEEWSERHGNFDRAKLEDTKYFKLDCGHEYVVYKDSDVMEEHALELVTQTLTDEPEMFTQSWLINYIDTEKLKREIGDPYEEWEDENVPTDYGELLQKMVDENCIDDGDDVFFKRNGEARVENKVRAKALDAIKDDYVANNKPTVDDPMDWLREIYSEEEVIKEAIRMAGIDVKAAAKSAVDTDGAAHFLNSYSGTSEELAGGALYVRMS